MSCLFNSLASFLDTTSPALRRNIALFLHTNPELYDEIKAKDFIEWAGEGDLGEYASRMARSSTWGTAVEIKACCELYDVDITVHVLYTGREIKFESIYNPRKVIHISYTGSHYEPMYAERVSESNYTPATSVSNYRIINP